jgi:hypothetical protein
MHAGYCIGNGVVREAFQSVNMAMVKGESGRARQP